MAIPYKSEEQAHKEFLRFQKQMEIAVKKLHDDVGQSIDKIIQRNTNSKGTIDKYKIKLIVDKYMTQELKYFRQQLSKNIKSSVKDSADFGIRSVVGSKAPNRKINANIFLNISKSIRKDILNNRGVDGITLSERIWKLTQNNTYELKRILSGDILQGKSAQQISKNIQQFLKRPTGSTPSQGQGVYKSAYKNAERVARTETNRAYIDGQKSTAKSMGYKLQYQITNADDSECLQHQGKIFEPDDFPAPVHPNCMCYALSVLPE